MQTLVYFSVANKFFAQKMTATWSRRPCSAEHLKDGEGPRPRIWLVVSLVSMTRESQACSQTPEAPCLSNSASLQLSVIKLALDVMKCANFCVDRSRRSLKHGLEHCNAVLLLLQFGADNDHNALYYIPRDHQLSVRWHVEQWRRRTVEGFLIMLHAKYWTSAQQKQLEWSTAKNQPQPLTFRAASRHILHPMIVTFRGGPWSICWQHD